jgi:hypothetical protein
MINLIDGSAIHLYPTTNGSTTLTTSTQVKVKSVALVQDHNLTDDRW